MSSMKLRRSTRGDGGKGNKLEDVMQWVVADLQSPDFGKLFDNQALINAGTMVGDMCIVQLPDKASNLILQKCASPDDFIRKAKPQLDAMGCGSPVSPAGSLSAGKHLRDEGHSRRRSELSHLDITATRPALVLRRVLYCVSLLVFQVTLAHHWYRDTPPSVLWPVAVTFLYPLLLIVATRYMSARSRPAERYVFEFLLAFDLYQMLTSAAILCLTIREAHNLEMLRYPWGNSASISSPLLRLLLWVHYQNRIIELLDTFIRISQKRLKAYGSLHVYLRIVSVWSWWVACQVGGGDTYFLIMLDSFVCSIRFFVYTLSILRWNWNWSIDFGMHAPKFTVFRNEHLYHLQVAEFYLLLLHALYALAVGNMPPSTMAMQVLVMVSGACIFTDFYVSRDALKHSGKEYSDGRLMISFDSSAWLFMYHFGVAMWIEDNIDHKKPESIGYSGSSGGALVAGTLSAGIDARDLSSFVIDNSWPVAGKNPFLLLRECEIALDKFLPKDAHVTSTSVLRVLLTRVSARPPFLQGEVVSRFSTWSEIFSCLRASCHMPIFGGVLPYPVEDHGWYYDGLLWNSLFVPWRTFDSRDSLIKVSAFGHPGADIYPTRFIIPPWMAVFPPCQESLRGMVAMGYSDADDFFHGRTRCWGGQVSTKTRESTKRDLLMSLARSRPRKSRLTQQGLDQIQILRSHVVFQWRAFGCLVASGIALLAFLLL